MESDEKADAAGGSALGIAGLADAFEVARGGFATVYRARQPLLDRIIAVKLIHATVIDPLGGERFLREVKATGRLSQHPNVAPVYDVGTTSSGQPYLIMPFFARGSLSKLVEREGALDEVAAVRIGRTLADTLEYVHQHGVLHRDIKPANVLMSDAGEPLLCDFGVARLTDASVSLHTTGTSVVTWAYGPPEAFTGDEPTPAWDIYSLGATMYTLLTGVPPFVDGNDVNVFTVLNRIGNVDVPDLRERGISPPVADAVRQAMAKAPADRPSSAAAFSALLARRFDPPRREPKPPPQPPPPPPPADEEAAKKKKKPPPRQRAAAPPPPDPPEEKVRATARKPPRDAPTAAAAATQPARRLRGSAVVFAVAGAALSIAGATQPIFRFSDETWLSNDTNADVRIVAPAVVLAMTVLLLAARNVAAEWLVGAAAAFLALGYAQSTALTLDTEFGWLSMGLRTGGAALVLVALVLAWPAGQQRGRPISTAQVVALLAGCGAAMVGTWQVYSDDFSTELSGISVGATAGLLLLLIARVFLLRAKTTAAAALTAAGLSGAVVWGITLRAYIDSDSSGSAPVVASAAGFAAIFVVGLSRWLRPHRSPDPAPVGSRY